MRILTNRTIQSFIKDVLFDMVDFGHDYHDIDSDSLAPCDLEHLCGLIISLEDQNLECITQNDQLFVIKNELVHALKAANTAYDQLFMDTLKEVVIAYYTDTINKLIAYVMPEVLDAIEESKQEEEI